MLVVSKWKNLAGHSGQFSKKETWNFRSNRGDFVTMV